MKGMIQVAGILFVIVPREITLERNSTIQKKERLVRFNAGPKLGHLLLPLKKGGKINGINVHLPSIEESEPVDDGINGSRAENALVDQNLPELFSRWKELESLVQGGVPKDLRGEVKWF